MKNFAEYTLLQSKIWEYRHSKFLTMPQQIERVVMVMKLDPHRDWCYRFNRIFFFFITRLAFAL